MKLPEEEPRRLARDEQISLERRLRVAIYRSAEKGRTWICERLREALYYAAIGLEPPTLGEIRPLMMGIFGYDPLERDTRPKGEKRPGLTRSGARKPPSLKDLRQRIYTKAKAEPAKRFWGLYVHVCKKETLREAYRMAKANNGAPGIDGVTFEAIEKSGVEEFLEQIRDELVSRTYLPLRNRRKEIPKGGGKTRTLGIPAIRDRVVQGALKLILEPIFEADFQPGSYGYRPKRQAHEAVDRVARAIVGGKTKVIDLDLSAYFDNIRHHILFEKVAKRVNDDDVMHLLKLIVKANGKKGVPQGGIVSPLLSNIYLDEVDRMLEKAKEKTRRGGRDALEYARYADDLVVLVDGTSPQAWLVEAVNRRLREELGKLQVEVNEEKSRNVDLTRGESFGFLGFEFRRVRTRRGKWRPHFTPRHKARKELTCRLRKIFRRTKSQPIARPIGIINPILRGWVNYFRVGNSSRCFSYIRWWVERKVRRHLMRARQRSGYGWKRWSSAWIYRQLGLYKDYRLRRIGPGAKALPCP